MVLPDGIMPFFCNAGLIPEPASKTGRCPSKIITGELRVGEADDGCYPEMRDRNAVRLLVRAGFPVLVRPNRRPCEPAGRSAFSDR